MTGKRRIFLSGYRKVSFRETGAPLLVIFWLGVAGCSSGGGGEVVQTPRGGNLAPVFAGIEPIGAGEVTAASVLLQWEAASDDRTAPSGIVYSIYLAAASGAQDFGVPTDRTSAGATSYTLSGLQPETVYFVVVLAQDEEGVLSAAIVERSFTTLPVLTTGNFRGPLINVAAYHDYTPEQVAAIDARYNTCTFSRNADQAFRDQFDAGHARGMYLSMTTILHSEAVLAPDDFVAKDVNSGAPFRNPDFEEDLATFWDTAWLNYRWSMTDLEAVDFVFLDLMPLTRFDWLLNPGAVLPPEIDTDEEWRAAILDVIRWVRGKLPSDVLIVVNSIKDNAAGERFDGYDTIGTGLADYGILEGFIFNTGGDSVKQIRQLQLVTRASVLQKPLIAVFKWDPQTGAVQDRIDALAKYLLMADPPVTTYNVADAAQWSSFPPLYFPEQEIDFGNPIDPVPSQIMSWDAQTSVPPLLIRRWDSEFVVIVNTTEAPVPIPAEYSNAMMLVLTGNPAIDAGGNVTAATGLVPFSELVVPARQGIILFP